MFRFLISLALLCANISLYAQSDQNPLKFDVIPPGPEAASYGKFVDNPVSAYTGVPKIDVPIYTLKSFELSLPVSLSYHASGVKWEEIPSWVGSGWTLNAGGIVSRTIRGRNDEDQVFGYFMTSIANSYNIPSFFSGGAFSTANFNYVMPNCAPSDPPTDEYMNMIYAAKGGLDLEPDQFFFSLPDGQSGKFMFSRSQQMRVIPHQYTNITHTANPSTSKLFDKWLITGLDGTKYFFEKQEITTNNTPCKELHNGTPETYTIPDVVGVSSWKLVKMENSSGTDSIKFTYVEENISYDAKMSVTTYDRVSGELGPPGANSCINNTVITGWRLSEISTASGYKMQFVATSSRGDLTGGKMLDQVKIYFKDTFIKRFDFSYDGSPVILDAVQEHLAETGSGAALPSYDFTYYGLPSVPIYDRNSYNLDHWGYYNGSDNTAWVTPPVVYDNVYYNGANRNPDLESCRWMTLKEIEYPTGGTVNYEYELNDYSNLPANMDLDHLSQLELIESVEFTVTNTNLPIAYQTKPFTLSQDEQAVMFFEIPDTGSGIPVSGLHATLSKSSGAPFSTMQFLSSYSQTTASILYNLTAGSYTLYGEFDDGVYALGSQKFYVKIYKFKSMESLIQAGIMKGGGLRVKKIISEGDNAITKSYSYVKQSTGLSSGKLLSFPSYSYLAGFSDGQMMGSSCVTTNSATILVRTQATSIPLSVSQGGHVGYSEVTEYIGTPLANIGHTVYTYTNTPDVQTIFFPFVPAQSYSYKNGLLLTQEEYSSADKLVKKTENTYTYENDAGFIIQGARIALSNNSGCTGCSNRNFTYSVYSEPTERVLLTATNSKVFDISYDSYIESGATMAYNAYDQVALKTQTISNEPVKKKYTKYTYHAAFKTSPIQEYSYYSTDNSTNFELIGGIERSLASPDKPTDVTLLQKLPEVISTNDPETFLYNHRVHLERDNKTNIVTIEKAGDPSVTSVIWDKHQVFPIAQIINAEPDEVAFTSFENGSTEGGWTFTASASTTEKKTGISSHKLNQSVARSGLTSGDKYIVSYWAKGGTPTINGVIDNNDAASAEADGWKYYEKIVSGITTLTISGTISIFIDELRLYPIDAQMTTYCHDAANGLISSTDVNNVTTYYTYNNRRQLEFVKDFEYRILKKNEYRYARD